MDDAVADDEGGIEKAATLFWYRNRKRTETMLYLMQTIVDDGGGDGYGSGGETKQVSLN